MKTKWFILSIWTFLAIITVTAIILTPGKEKNGKVVLKWATDPCPQRDDQVNEFNRLYPNCLLEIDPDNTGTMKVVVQCSAHMGPDLIDHVNQNSIQTYSEAGILWNVKPLADKMGFGLETLPEKLRPLVRMTMISPEGELIEGQCGYPCNVGCITLFYNKNLFDKLKVPYPSKDLTWKKYIQIAKALTYREKPDSVVPDIFGAAGTDLKALIMAKGGTYFNESGTRTLIDGPEFLDAFELYHKLMYDYKVEPTPNQKSAVSSQGGWGSGYITWFGEGKVAMLWGSRWILVQLRRLIKQQKEKRAIWLKEHPNADSGEAPEVMRLGCVMLPRFEGHERVVPSYAKCTGININSSNREDSLKFLQYLAGKNYSMIINKGGDGLPGNKNYNRDLKLLINPEFPGEEEVHNTEIASLKYGAVFKDSPFINAATVNRVLRKVSEKLIATPKMTREEIAEELRTAAHEINRTISRNISRTPRLFKLYCRMLSKGIEPVAEKLERPVPAEIIKKIPVAQKK